MFRSGCDSRFRPEHYVAIVLVQYKNYGLLFPGFEISSSTTTFFCIKIIHYSKFPLNIMLYSNFPLKIMLDSPSKACERCPDMTGSFFFWSAVLVLYLEDTLKSSPSIPPSSASPALPLSPAQSGLGRGRGVAVGVFKREGTS